MMSTGNQMDLTSMSKDELLAFIQRQNTTNNAPTNDDHPILKLLHGMFDQMDENKDGHLVYDEFAGMFEQRLRQFSDDRLLRPVFEFLAKGSGSDEGSMSWEAWSEKCQQTIELYPEALDPNEILFQTFKRLYEDVKKTGLQSGSWKDEMKPEELLAKLSKAFRKGDKNRDSRLSWDEFRKLMGTVNKDSSVSERQQLFSSLTINTEGMFHYRTFLKAMKKIIKEYPQYKAGEVLNIIVARLMVTFDTMQKFGSKVGIDSHNPQKGKVMRIFKKYDKDHNGYLEKKEFMACLRAHGVQLTSDELEQVFADVNKSHSGNVSFKEFQGALKPFTKRFTIDEVSDALGLLIGGNKKREHEADDLGSFNAMRTGGSVYRMGVKARRRCTKCKGSGDVNGGLCDVCEGSGQITVPEFDEKEDAGGRTRSLSMSDIHDPAHQSLHPKVLKHSGSTGNLITKQEHDDLVRRMDEDFERRQRESRSRSRRRHEARDEQEQIQQQNTDELERKLKEMEDQKKRMEEENTKIRRQLNKAESDKDLLERRTQEENNKLRLRLNESESEKDLLKKREEQDRARIKQLQDEAEERARLRGINAGMAMNATDKGIAIVGAGVGDCNGLFNESGELHGKPVFSNDKGVKMSWDGRSWNISGPSPRGGTALFYRSPVDSVLPPSRGWAVGEMGKLPLPRVYEPAGSIDINKARGARNGNDFARRLADLNDRQAELDANKSRMTPEAWRAAQDALDAERRALNSERADARKSAQRDLDAGAQDLNRQLADMAKLEMEIKADEGELARQKAYLQANRHEMSPQEIADAEEAIRRLEGDLRYKKNRLSDLADELEGTIADTEFLKGELDASTRNGDGSTSTDESSRRSNNNGRFEEGEHPLGDDTSEGADVARLQQEADDAEDELARKKDYLANNWDRMTSAERRRAQADVTAAEQAWLAAQMALRRRRSRVPGAASQSANANSNSHGAASDAEEEAEKEQLSMAQRALEARKADLAERRRQLELSKFRGTLTPAEQRAREAENKLLADNIAREAEQVRQLKRKEAALRSKLGGDNGEMGGCSGLTSTQRTSLGNEANETETGSMPGGQQGSSTSFDKDTDRSREQNGQPGTEEDVDVLQQQVGQRRRALAARRAALARKRSAFERNKYSMTPEQRRREELRLEEEEHKIYKQDAAIEKEQARVDKLADLQKRGSGFDLQGSESNKDATSDDEVISSLEAERRRLLAEGKTTEAAQIAQKIANRKAMLAKRAKLADLEEQLRLARLYGADPSVIAALENQIKNLKSDLGQSLQDQIDSADNMEDLEAMLAAAKRDGDEDAIAAIERAIAERKAAAQLSSYLGNGAEDPSSTEQRRMEARRLRDGLVGGADRRTEQAQRESDESAAKRESERMGDDLLVSNDPTVQELKKQIAEAERRGEPTDALRAQLAARELALRARANGITVAEQRLRDLEREAQRARGATSADLRRQIEAARQEADDQSGSNGLQGLKRAQDRLLDARRRAMEAGDEDEVARIDRELAALAKSIEAHRGTEENDLTREENEARRSRLNDEDSSFEGQASKALGGSRRQRRSSEVDSSAQHEARPGAQSIEEQLRNLDAEIAQAQRDGDYTKLAELRARRQALLDAQREKSANNGHSEAGTTNSTPSNKMTLDELRDERRRAAEAGNWAKVAELDRAIAKKLEAEKMRQALRQLSVGQREQADAIKRKLREMGEPVETHERDGSSSNPALAQALAEDAKLQRLREHLANAPDADTAAWIRKQIQDREAQIRCEVEGGATKDARVSDTSSSQGDEAEAARRALIDARAAEQLGNYSAASKLSARAANRLGEAAREAERAGDYRRAADLQKQGAQALMNAARQAEAAGNYVQAARLQKRAADELNDAAAKLAAAGDNEGALDMKRQAADALEDAARRFAAAGDYETARRLRAEAAKLRDEIEMAEAKSSGPSTASEQTNLGASEATHALRRQISEAKRNGEWAKAAKLQQQLDNILSDKVESVGYAARTKTSKPVFQKLANKISDERVRLGNVARAGGMRTARGIRDDLDALSKEVSAAEIADAPKRLVPVRHKLWNCIKRTNDLDRRNKRNGESTSPKDKRSVLDRIRNLRERATMLLDELVGDESKDTQEDTKELQSIDKEAKNLESAVRDTPAEDTKEINDIADCVTDLGMKLDHIESKREPTRNDKTRRTWLLKKLQEAKLDGDDERLYGILEDLAELYRRTERIEDLFKTLKQMLQLALNRGDFDKATKHEAELKELELLAHKADAQRPDNSFRVTSVPTGQHVNAPVVIRKKSNESQYNSAQANSGPQTERNPYAYVPPMQRKASLGKAPVRRRQRGQSQRPRASSQGSRGRGLTNKFGMESYRNRNNLGQMINEFGSESYGKASGTFNSGNQINLQINVRPNGSAQCEVDSLFRAAKPKAAQQAQIMWNRGSTRPSAAVKGSRVTIFDPKDGAYHLGTVVDIKDGRSQHMLHIRWKQFGTGWFPVRSSSLKKFDTKRGSTHGFGVLA